MQLAYVGNRLPDVEKELTLSLDDATRRLNQLPAPKFDDPSSELVGLIFEFAGAVSWNVRGVSQVDHFMPSLMQGIRTAQISLRSSIMRTAPRFCAWVRQDTPPGSPNSMLSDRTMSNGGAPAAWIAEPTFLSSEERVPFDDRTGKIMYLDEVMERAEQYVCDCRVSDAFSLGHFRSITRELPGDLPTYSVKEELIRLCLRGWGRPMLDYFETVHNLMNQHMKILVDTHFGKHMHSGLHARAMWVSRHPSGT